MVILNYFLAFLVYSDEIDNAVLYIFICFKGDLQSILINVKVTFWSWISNNFIIRIIIVPFQLSSLFIKLSWPSHQPWSILMIFFTQTQPKKMEKVQNLHDFFSKVVKFWIGWSSKPNQVFNFNRFLGAVHRICARFFSKISYSLWYRVYIID